jgi:hypothetical protein
VDLYGNTNKFITLLPSDSRIWTIYSRVHETKYDSKKILSLVNLSLDKKLEKERPLEKMAS